MNKALNIAIAIVISLFLTGNLYLLFSSKSVIPKSVYVDRYERMTNANYSEKIVKQGFIAPEEINTVYIDDEDTIDTWLIKEGDQVKMGDKIALLQIKQTEGQRAVWEAEREAFLQQQSSLKRTIVNLKFERRKAQSKSSSNVNRTDNATKNTDDTKVKVGLNVNVQVDVKQEGTFAQAIAAADQELADIERQITVIEMQLTENPLHPALLSPVEGFVSEVTRRGSRLAVDIFSSQQVIVTYAKNDEWNKIKIGDPAIIQIKGITKVLKGTVQSVSPVPAVENKWLETYKSLDTAKIKNSLAYYEVRIVPDSSLETTPFGTNISVDIIVNKAMDTPSVKEEWLHNLKEGTADIWFINPKGRAEKVEIVTSFSWEKRAVVTKGLQLGSVALYEPTLYVYDYAPEIFLPFPADIPKKSEWKTFGWKNYAKYLLVK
ncbi:efflux RND transporter periplasmic adaptor subunit [Sporosarcina limicola]|uniref:HlyD family secretion protein n=1 Tax=Sporosarcina limicola TaxID=34101 RepID=A0A927MML0_9BACL|nr:efflux RND transporter periplasmic adaptor subunit [Sporosarcina limicola]MBE1555672.1 HlyD family secretion protein [Sporosarcina limicola]